MLMILSLLSQLLLHLLLFLLLTASAFIFFTFAVYKVLQRLHSPHRSVHVHGSHSQKYDRVYRAFRKNLLDGWERDGGAFCVFENGEAVVDIWGGYADKESRRPWREDTMNVAFSSSKAVGALCVAILVDRGVVDYSEKVSSFWPEFGQYGKERITVQMILSHTAGLVHLDTEITMEDAQDHKRMAVIFEQQAPNWEPGSCVGYHALTYGWLVDQIIRRVDRKGRGIGQFFQEEVAIPYEIDFHIGLPLSEAHRVARLSTPSLWNRISEFLTDPSNVNYNHIFRSFLTSGLLWRAGMNAPWLQCFFVCFAASIRSMPLNNPELYAIEQCAVVGIGTARALARLFFLVLDGKIISKKTLEQLAVPVVQEEEKDIVTAAYQARGHGFTHQYIHDAYDRRVLLLGHSGFGGQNVRIDLTNRISFAYLSNGLKGGLGDRARTYRRLLEALYASMPPPTSMNSFKQPLTSCSSQHRIHLRSIKEVELREEID